MDPLAEFTKQLELSGNQDMAQFARQTWQQLEHHAAQGPQSYRKFQEQQLSAALGNVRPEQSADRVAMLRIETSIAPPAGSLLVNTAQVHIRIYRAAPSLAESLSGSFARTKSTGNAGLPALNLKLLWQSAQLDDKAKGVVFVDVEVSARAVDAALKGSAVSSRAHLLQQVLQTLEKRHNVKLSSKSAQVLVLKPEAQQHPPAAHSGHEDLSSIPAGHSRLPASLLTKLSVVNLCDANAVSDKSRNMDIPCQDTRVANSNLVSKRPLIVELDP
ncbi:hypothetical protein ABBQ38_011222 [Trebouxia sp. C0009 RCD-2024]